LRHGPSCFPVHEFNETQLYPPRRIAQSGFSYFSTKTPSQSWEGDPG
jgi:hypothetical protein